MLSLSLSLMPARHVANAPQRRNFWYGGVFASCMLMEVTDTSCVYQVFRNLVKISDKHLEEIGTVRPKVGSNRRVGQDRPFSFTHMLRPARNSRFGSRETLFFLPFSAGTSGKGYPAVIVKWRRRQKQNKTKQTTTTTKRHYFSVRTFTVNK